MKRVDWRFLLCLALLLIVSSVVWTGYETARDNRAKGERIDALVETLQAERADAHSDALQAEAERARLLAQLRSLHRQYERLEDYQTALVRYLRAEGIDLPVRFVRVPQSIAPRRTITPRPRFDSPAAPGARSSQPPTTGSGKAHPGKGKGHANRKAPHGKGKRK